MSVQNKVAGHVFISYVREDSHRVDQLQRTLQAAGIRVWRDTADLWPGEDWRIKIRRAITGNALVFIACFSHASLARSKSYQNEELTLAVEQLRLRPPDDPWLIPVRFDECEIPERDIGGGRTLTSIQRADLFGRRSEDDAARLVDAVLHILGTGSSDLTSVTGFSFPKIDRERRQPDEQAIRTDAAPSRSPVIQNLLIVDCEHSWREVYERNAARVGGFSAIIVAGGNLEATRMIEMMQFSVAILEITLDIDDDQDLGGGLLVMDKIRASGDETSIVVVTGSLGNDIVQAVRDSILKYQAHDIISKGSLRPQHLRDLIASGQRAFEARKAARQDVARLVLSGDAALKAWSDEMLRGAAARDGVSGINEFVNQLLAPFFAIVPRRDEVSLYVDAATDMMYGSYWSRSTGQPIACCFADRERASEIIEEAKSTRSLMGRYEIREVLKESFGNELGGAVFAINDVRDAFAAI